MTSEQKALANLLDAVEGVLQYTWDDNDEDATEAINRLSAANEELGVVQRLAQQPATQSSKDEVEPLVTALVQAVRMERDEFHERCNNSYSTDALMFAKERVALCKAALLDAMEREIERMRGLWHGQSDYSIKLQRLIERFCSGIELPYPELHHHRMLAALRSPVETNDELSRAKRAYGLIHTATYYVPKHVQLHRELVEYLRSEPPEKTPAHNSGFDLLTRDELIESCNELAREVDKLQAEKASADLRYSDVLCEECNGVNGHEPTCSAMKAAVPPFECRCFGGCKGPMTLPGNYYCRQKGFPENGEGKP